MNIRLGSIDIKVNNFDKVQQGYKETPKLFERAFRRGFDISGSMQVKYIRNRMLHDPKSGRIYKRYVGVGGRVLKKPTKYQASAPGEFPGVITKALYKSVFYEVRGSDQLAIGMGGPEAPYAKILEKGGENGAGAYVEARSPLKQTTEEFADKVPDEINKQVKALLHKQGISVT